MTKIKTAEKLTFRKIGDQKYQVYSPGGTLAGIVQASFYSDVWHSFYNDGTQGYSGRTRVDAAWKLINS